MVKNKYILNINIQKYLNIKRFLKNPEFYFKF